MPAGRELTEQLMDNVCDDSFAKELAEISESENFKLKNRYMHNKKTMAFADKKRMAVDERSVRDMLRNSHIFRSKIEQEVPTYTDLQNNTQFEYGLLTYLREGAAGELADLVKEVGIERKTTPFFNMEMMRQYRDNMVHDSDSQL